MSIAGLNHHFATKTQLLEAVFDRSREVAVTMFTSTDPLDNLRASLHLAQSNQGDPRIIRLFAVMSAEATSPDHPAHHRLLQHYEATLKAVHGSFVELARTGRLRPDVRPEDAARAYVALSDGLQIQAMYQPEAFSQPDVIRRLLSSFLTEPL